MANAQNAYIFQFVIMLYLFFRKAIVVRPNYPEARNLLVVLLFRRGDEFTAEALSATKELEQLLDGFSLSGNSERGSASSAATAARSCSPPIAEVHASRAADSYDICSAGPTTVTAPTAPTLSMTAAGSGEAVPESSARGLASAFYRLSLPLSSQVHHHSLSLFNDYILIKYFLRFVLLFVCFTGTCG